MNMQVLYITRAPGTNGVCRVHNSTVEPDMGRLLPLLSECAGADTALSV